jgi:hypothetical protein
MAHLTTAKVHREKLRTLLHKQANRHFPLSQGMKDRNTHLTKHRTKEANFPITTLHKPYHSLEFQFDKRFTSQLLAQVFADVLKDRLRVGE